MLPKIAQQTSHITLPLTKKDVEIRPFLMKEQKLLLMANESDTKDEQERIKETTEALTKVLEACILTEGIVLEDLPSVDIEYLYLKLRCLSINNKIPLVYKMSCTEEGCEPEKKISIDLNNVSIENIDISNVIKITNDIGVKMKFPTPKMLTKHVHKDLKLDVMYDILTESIECIFDGESVYSDFSHDELYEWLENQLNVEQIQKLYDFFNNLPYLLYKQDVVCETCGKKETLEIKGIQNFFM